MKRSNDAGAARSSLRGHYRDSALSSRERSVSSPGLRWIVMAVVVTLPWTRAEMGFAFLVCPGYNPPPVSERLGKRHKTGERTLEICTGTALWYRYGYAPLPIRWVLTRDPAGKRPRHPPSFPPILPRRQNRSSATRMKRWSLEVTFEEGRAQMAHRNPAPVVRSSH
jgi:hypothetical protein